ncbi:MAG: PIN domain-containing protein [Candidatus Omnitrophica bacterium]|nr:PIN domain-containing protein [Candidatus Omnitrophota bacterium]
MTVFILRLFFVVLSAFVGAQLTEVFDGPSDWVLKSIGAGIAVGVAVVAIIIEYSSKNISVRGLSAAVFGLLFGLIMAKLVTDAFYLVPLNDRFSAILNISVLLIFCYFGMVVAVRGRDEFKVVIPYVRFEQQNQVGQLIVLDTSVIIDGRVLDIAQTHFLDGTFVVPRFVLKELQAVADNPSPLKRNRGRRGLEILNKLRRSEFAEVKIHDEDFPAVAEVDAKLVKLAKVLDAKVLTNDYNLNKVAELENVIVLNINELANALKPVVLPGESLEIKLVKEGKEYNQAVGYLSDGTMVVVENSRNLIGKTVNTIVTSVLQTSAGRMIFSRVDEGNGGEGKIT